MSSTHQIQRSFDPERRKLLCQNSAFFFYFLVNKFKKISKIILFALFFNFSSCCFRPECDLEKTHPHNIQNESLVAQTIPSNPNQIPWYHIGDWTLWMLFGNDDDGIFGERSGVDGFDEEHKTWDQAFKWWLRNPLHNFCYYVIGTADRDNHNWIVFECSPYEVSCCHTAVKNPDEIFPSFTFALNGGKPFFRARWAYNKQRKGEIYFGWRERGNFGIKCQVYGKRIGR